MRELSTTRYAVKYAAKRLWRVAVGGLIGMAIVIAGNSVARAADADPDGDDEQFEQKVIKNILGALGVDVGRQNSINYQERPPLVIPPSRDLPPPEAAAPVNNPAWPVNPEVRAKKKKNVDRRNANEDYYTFGQGNEASPRVQRELQRGAAAGAGRVTAPDPNANAEVSRPLKGSEMGDTGGSWFSSWNINSLLGYKQEEQAPFNGEPPRNNLTQPPTGYQTPSVQYPYGINPNNKQVAPPSILERGAMDDQGKVH